jgi:uncharacterized RDD family membrane protein YckC
MLLESAPATVGTADHTHATGIIRSRGAAQIVDYTLVGFVFWWIGQLLAQRYGGVALSGAGITMDGRPAVTHYGVLVVGLFLYFFVSEAMFGRTIGKGLCRLTVLGRGQRRCGVAAAFIRTAARPVDFLCAPILFALSSDRRRLGDLIAGTSVIANPRRSLAFAHVDSPTPCAWETRVTASIIDAGSIALFTAAYVFATGEYSINHGVHIRVDAVSLIGLLELLFVYFIAAEGIYGGTLGKIVCGLRVCCADGTRCGFTEAVLRCVWRPLDLCMAGIVAFVLIRYTADGRHIGDKLAATIVVIAPLPHRRPILPLLSLPACACLFASYPLAVKYFLIPH